MSDRKVYYYDDEAEQLSNPLASDALHPSLSADGTRIAFVSKRQIRLVDAPLLDLSIKKMQQLLDIGTKYVRQGKPELIADEVYKVMLPELEKLRPARGEAIYKYATGEHVSSQMKLFAQYCQERLK